MRGPGFGFGTFGGVALPVDLSVPVLLDAATDETGLIVTLTYSKLLDSSSVPAPISYGLSGTVAPVNTVNVVANAVVLGLGAPVFVGESPLLDYALGSSPVRDTQGNVAAALDDEPVTNNSTQVSAPTYAPALSLVDENDVARPLMSYANTVTALVEVDDSDGFATTGVDIYDESSVLVGAAVNVGGSVWELAIGTLAPGATGTTYGYFARRVTASGDVDSDLASVLVHDWVSVWAADGAALMSCWADVGWSVGGSSVTWADQAAVPHDWTSTSLASSPSRAQDPTIGNRYALTYDGSNDKLVSSLTLPAPATTPTWHMWAIKQNAWTSGRNIESSAGGAGMQVLFQSVNTPELRQSNGTAANATAGLGENVWGLVFGKFTGSASDSLQAGDGTPVTGNAGNNASTGNRHSGCNNAITAFASYSEALKVKLPFIPSDQTIANALALADAHWNDGMEHGPPPQTDPNKILVSTIAYTGMSNTRNYRTPFATNAAGSLRYCIHYNTSRIVVGKRSLPNGGWALTTGASFVNGQSDPHNYGTIALDGNDRLWASWGMHGNPLKMWWASSIGDTYIDSNKAAGGFVDESAELSVTYPGFTPCRDGTGDLFFDYRGEGGSGNGNWFLLRCVAATQTGLDVHSPLIDGTSVNLSPYPSEPIVDSAGTMYMAWCQRRTTDITTNSNIYFAMSPVGDPAATWLDKDGGALPMPIPANSTAARIDAIAEGMGLNNVFGACIDEAAQKFFITTYADLNGDGVSDFYVWVVELLTGTVTRYDNIAGLTAPFVVSGGMTETPLTAPFAVVSGGNLHVIYRCDELGNGYHDTWAPIADLGAGETPAWTNTALYSVDDIDQSMPAIDWSAFEDDPTKLVIWHQASHYTPSGGTSAYELTRTLPT